MLDDHVIEYRNVTPEEVLWALREMQVLSWAEAVGMAPTPARSLDRRRAPMPQTARWRSRLVMEGRSRLVMEVALAARNGSGARGS
jgi:hypothetical protein